MALPKYLHGPSVYDWLVEVKRLQPDRDLTRSMARRVRAWHEGEHPVVWTVDAVLTHMGHHLSEIPEEFYRDNRPRYQRWFKFAPEVKVKAVAEMEAGRSTSAIAKELGACPSSVRDWRREARRRAGDSTLDAVASSGLREAE